MEDDEPAAPKKDDVLFAGDQKAWHMDALLDHDPGRDYAYREGYRRAGRILTDWAAQNRETDFLVFPICHAYRHFVELALKNLILQGMDIIEREMTPHETKLQNETHNLKSLWTAFKAIEREITKTQELDPAAREHMEGIESYIDQLHAVDAGSFSFRYPVTKKGDVSLGELKRINLGKFANHMDTLCNYLEGFNSYYAHMIEMRNDMYSDYADSMYDDSGY